MLSFQEGRIQHQTWQNGNLDVIVMLVKNTPKLLFRPSAKVGPRVLNTDLLLRYKHEQHMLGIY